MGLKSDLEQSFKINLEDSGEIADIANLIVGAYESSVNESKDLLGNSWSNVKYSLIEQAIIGAFNLSLKTSTFLIFTPIELSLIAAWSSASLSIPAIPPPGMSLVTSGSVTSSFPVGTLPLIKETDSIDTIVNKFFNMFSRHAKTLIFNYSGLATAGTPPPTIKIPITSFIIK